VRAPSSERPVPLKSFRESESSILDRERSRRSRGGERACVSQTGYPRQDSRALSNHKSEIRSAINQIKSNQLSLLAITQSGAQSTVNPQCRAWAEIPARASLIALSGVTLAAAAASAILSI